MKIVGDVRKYAEFQAADSISIAAKNEGGAGAGIGMGVGMAMSQNMISAGDAPDAMAKIKQLHELLKAGAISEEEFNAKKTELLGQIK
jgi:membrane protease subunit (stomatin/prohibitin family)